MKGLCRTKRPSLVGLHRKSTTLVVLPAAKTRASALISPCFDRFEGKLIFISIVANMRAGLPERARKGRRSLLPCRPSHRHDPAVDDPMNLLIVDQALAWLNHCPAAFGLSQVWNPKSG